MAEVRELVEAEMENIDRVVGELPDSNSFASLSSLELAGVTALIHNFYNGIENILKQIIISFGKKLPDTASWHRDIVKMAASNGIVSESTAEEPKRYLAFRHFFSHGYSFDLDPERITPLVNDITKTLASFKDDINKAIKRL